MDEPLLFPAEANWLLALIPVALVAFTVVAVISIARVMRITQNPSVVVWLLVVFLIPVAGPICWFTFGRRAVLTPAGSRSTRGS